MYYGYINEWSVQYTHWTQYNIPMRCVISVNFTMLPMPPGPAAAERQRQPVVSAADAGRQPGHHERHEPGPDHGAADHGSRWTLMAIIAGSRYADSKVATVVKDGKDVAVIVPSMQQPFSFKYVSHQVTEGERVDNIAYQYYTDPTMWFRIADANPDVLFWDDLAPGLVLRIPVVR